MEVREKNDKEKYEEGYLKVEEGGEEVMETEEM